MPFSPADALEYVDQEAPALAALGLNQLDAHVGKHGLDLVRHGSDQG